MMKNLKHVLVSIGVLLCTQFVFSQGITGTAHDFTASGSGANYSTEKCNVCHTPHNANTTVADAPLWDHALTAVTTYDLYLGVEMDFVQANPDGPSKLCLSCHDGTVSVNNYGGVDGGTLMTGSTVVGALNAGNSDLSNDHPISFTYIDGTDAGLRDPASFVTSLGGFINDDLLAGTGKMECSSCHDVHDSAGNTSLLVIDNTGSSLCLTCHIK